MKKERTVILFTRFPRERRSKTRLSQEIGGSNAVKLHCAFLADIFLRFQERDFDLLVAGATGDTEEDFTDLLKDHGTFDWFFLPSGTTTDEQIFSSYQIALLNYEKAVLTASDIPQLSVKHIRKMFADLDHFDIVFHMNHDGGTCPQGMRKAYDLFTPMTARSISHCSEWRYYLEQLHLKYKVEREILIDIDTIDDLVMFHHWQNLLGEDSDMFCPITTELIKKMLAL